MSSEWSVTARWLFPVDQPPIANGVLTIEEDMIVSVDRPGGRKADLDLGNVAILPGLVNAHTHLDLGALRGKLPRPADFTQWLRAVVAYRRTSTPDDWRASIRAGIDECIAAGTTRIGDVSVGGHSLPPLAASPLGGIVFHELLGLTKQRAKQSWREARAWLDDNSDSKEVTSGLSPHAPYSVRASLFRLASRVRVPQTIHLAETPHEAELHENQQGPLRPFLEELGAWDAQGLAESLSWIVKLQPRTPHVLFVHANYLDAGLIAELRGRTVVYCPRTHAYFGHHPHSFVELLAAGVNVALGTDSLASNPDLSILEEMRFLWRTRSTEVSGETLLRMGTRNGASALHSHAGHLVPGRLADWITVPLPNDEADDSHRLLFESASTARDVVIGGEWIVRGVDTPQAAAAQVVPAPRVPRSNRP